MYVIQTPLNCSPSRCDTPEEYVGRRKKISCPHGTVIIIIRASKDSKVSQISREVRGGGGGIDKTVERIAFGIRHIPRKGGDGCAPLATHSNLR